MEIEVIEDEASWVDLLSSMNHDWYHSWDCHQIAMRQGDGKPLMFVYREAGIVIALPMLVRAIDEARVDANSVYGYPGFVANVKVDSLVMERFINALLEWARSKCIVSIFSRLNTLTFDCGLGISGVIKAGETVFVDVGEPLDEQRKGYRRRYVSQINKLQRDGFKVHYETDGARIDDFMFVYNATMDSLHAAARYYFERPYYESLFDSEEFEARLYLCAYGDEIACAGIFIYCGDIVQYHLGGTHPKFRDYAPAKLMMDQVRLDASLAQMKYFHLGGGLGGGRDSLFEFKAGFSKHIIDFYVLKLIADQSAYNALVGEKFGSAAIDSQYFPLYRA